MIAERPLNFGFEALCDLRVGVAFDFEQREMNNIHRILHFHQVRIRLNAKLVVVETLISFRAVAWATVEEGANKFHQRGEGNSIDDAVFPLRDGIVN